MSDDPHFDDHHEDEEADLLGDMAPASFHASDDWWRQLVARLNEAQLEQLRAGELAYVGFNLRGVEKVPLVPPPWLFDDAATGED